MGECIQNLKKDTKERRKEAMHDKINAYSSNITQFFIEQSRYTFFLKLQSAPPNG
jgi:hypothetical protein